MKTNIFGSSILLFFFLNATYYWTNATSSSVAAWLGVIQIALNIADYWMNKDDMTLLRMLCICTMVIISFFTFVSPAVYQLSVN